MSRKQNECPKDMFYKPWPLVEKCNKFNVTLASQGTWKSRALIQFLSGTRIGVGGMIEQLTGIYMGYIHAHLTRYSDGMDGDANRNCISRDPWNGQTIMLKTRIMYELLPKWLQRKFLWGQKDINLREFSNMLVDFQGVILIQDPWESLLTVRNKIRNLKRECGNCKSTKLNLRQDLDFEGKDFEDFMIQGARMWTDEIKTWIKKSPKGDNIIVDVDNFLSNPEPDLRRILKYLEVPVNEERLACVLEYPPRFGESSMSPKIRIIAKKLALENQKAINILIRGMEEINELLTDQGIKFTLSYKLPTL